MAAAGIKYINHRILPREQPQPPTIPDFPGSFHENSPTRLVRVKVTRQQVISPKRFVDRCQQRFDGVQSIRNRARGKVQSQQPKLFDRAVRRSLQVELFQQQMHPDARAIEALGQQLWRQRRGDRAWLWPTVTRPAIAFAANDFSIDDRFNFDLLAGVTLSEIRQRLATTSTDLRGRRYVDLFLAGR